MDGRGQGTGVRNGRGLNRNTGQCKINGKGMGKVMEEEKVQDAVNEPVIEPVIERKVPVEIYSRVVGYFRPVKQWNKGKQEEFSERRTFDAAKFRL